MTPARGHGGAKRGYRRRMERPGGVDDRRGKGVSVGGVADAEALESWREPWVGNDLESSRSVAAGAGIQRQNAERFKYREREIFMSSSCQLIND